MTFKCLLLLLAIQLVYSKCILPLNSKYNVSDIFLRDQIADFDYARITRYKPIFCCAQNYGRILWYFRETNQSNWILFPWFPVEIYSDTQPSLTDENQTLEIKQIGFTDSGQYRCDALSSENKVLAQHITRIEVFSCVDRVKPEAYPPHDQYGSVGETVTFTCIGDFGCNSDSARDVSWYDENWNMFDNSRYNIITTERANHTIVEANLTINTIIEEDFTKKFYCMISSSYPDHSIFEVKVKKTSFMISPAVVVGIGSAVVFVTVTLLLISALFFPWLKLFVLSRIPCGHMEEKGDKTYHVFILHDEIDTDTNCARTIGKKLKSDGYSVALSGKILGGQDILGRIQEYAHNSKSLIIIHPSDTPTNDFERKVAAQQYFSHSLVTVVMTSREIRMTLNSLKTLVKLVYPVTKYCGLYTHQKFYCELKLRMPRKGQVAQNNGTEFNIPLMQNV